MADDLAVTPGSGAIMRTKQLASGSHAQVVMVVTCPPTAVAGNQTLSVTTAADTTLTVPAGATHALLTVDTGAGDIRYWEDGSSPSSTAGLLVPAGGVAELAIPATTKLRSTSGTTVIQVSYRKYV